ncbi:MAG: redoxin domain-containing protein [Chloroflexi bacterium]|nr:redoxin domain-containing protein [Chloroflexota bacterium]
MKRFRENQDDYKNAGVTILDVSVDSFASQKAFAEANGGIDFYLLADFNPKGAVAQAYGVYNEERGVAGRSSFVIDSDGVIQDARTYPPGELPDPQELLGIAQRS